MPFKTLKNGRAALVAAAICVATAPTPSFATDGVWLDGASGNIGDDANWQTKYSGTTPQLTFANTTANAVPKDTKGVLTGVLLSLCLHYITKSTQFP